MITAGYRLALHLYPRRFRRQYGEQMAALLAAQLQDEPAARVIGRTLIDLLVTVPTRHMESHMTRATTTTAIAALVAMAGVLTVVGGPGGVVAALAVVGIAALTWSRNRPVVSTGDDRWWKLLLGGIALMVTLVIVTTATGELPSGGWFAAMAVGLTSIVLMAIGAVLGIAGRVRAT